MDSYADSLYAVNSDGLDGRDGAWEDAVGMQRTESQSSRATVDSSWTTSTSEHSSATEYSCADAFPPDGTWQDASSSYAGLCPVYETADANEMLSATGSQYQYQQSGHQLPSTGFPWPSPSQPFSTRAGIEEAARQATLAANSSIIINQQPFQDGGPLFITFEAVDEALQRHLDQGSEEPDRRAVQDVLSQQLYLRLVDIDRFYPDITTVLEEAAYQFQIRLQGPEVMEICYLAIVTVLAELTADPGVGVGIFNNGASPGSVDVHSPSSPASTLEPSPTDKEKFKCHYPGCTKGASRQADLERHWIQHLEDDKKPKYLCDYKPCPRHTSAFSRQDHFRDHLRAYHSEDLVRRGKEDDAAWWASRSAYALRKGWWRCSGCLVRVVLDRHGFVCPRCRKPCEKERQRYRRERMASVRGR